MLVILLFFITCSVTLRTTRERDPLEIGTRKKCRRLMILFKYVLLSWLTETACRCTCIAAAETVVQAGATTKSRTTAANSVKRFYYYFFLFFKFFSSLYEQTTWRDTCTTCTAVARVGFYLDTRIARVARTLSTCALHTHIFLYTYTCTLMDAVNFSYVQNDYIYTFIRIIYIYTHVQDLPVKGVFFYYFR